MSSNNAITVVLFLPWSLLALLFLVLVYLSIMKKLHYKSLPRLQLLFYTWLISKKTKRKEIKKRKNKARKKYTKALKREKERKKERKKKRKIVL